MQGSNTPLNRSQHWNKVYGQVMKYRTLGLDDQLALAGRLAPEIYDRMLREPDKIQNPGAYIYKAVNSEVTKLKERLALEEEKNLEKTPTEPDRAKELGSLSEPESTPKKDSPDQEKTKTL